MARDDVDSVVRALRGALDEAQVALGVVIAQENTGHDPGTYRVVQAAFDRVTTALDLDASATEDVMGVLDEIDRELDAVTSPGTVRTGHDIVSGLRHWLEQHPGIGLEAFRREILRLRERHNVSSARAFWRGATRLRKPLDPQPRRRATMVGETKLRLSYHVLPTHYDPTEEEPECP